MSSDVLASLPRAWLSVDLPGVPRRGDADATYSSFAYDELPRVPPGVDHALDWLRTMPEARGSLADDRDASPIRSPSAREVAALVEGTAARVPESFAAFIASPELQSRVRSATACYLDLGERVVPVEGGGSLIHFLSDQQWVLHWLLYSDPGGAEAVVVTDLPLGFELPDEELDELGLDAAALHTLRPGRTPSTAAVCAESFVEFLYRFRIENEIWFARALERRALTDEEQEYVAHYTGRTQ